MKKFLIVVFSLIFVIGVLSGCSGKKLADEFDEEEVIAKASEMLDVINSKDYEVIVDCFRDDLKSKITSDELKVALDEKIIAIGEFKGISNFAIIGDTDKETGDDYAVALLECNYELGSAVFTLVYDTDLELTGLFMK